jgi:hypothetical protein
MPTQLHVLNNCDNNSIHLTSYCWLSLNSFHAYLKLKPKPKLLAFSPNVRRLAANRQSLIKTHFFSSRRANSISVLTCEFNFTHKTCEFNFCVDGLPTPQLLRHITTDLVFTAGRAASPSSIAAKFGTASGTRTCAARPGTNHSITQSKNYILSRNPFQCKSLPIVTQERPIKLCPRPPVSSGFEATHNEVVLLPCMLYLLYPMNLLVSRQIALHGGDVRDNQALAEVAM